MRAERSNRRPGCGAAWALHPHSVRRSFAPLFSSVSLRLRLLHLAEPAWHWQTRRAVAQPGQEAGLPDPAKYRAAPPSCLTPSSLRGWSQDAQGGPSEAYECLWQFHRAGLVSKGSLYPYGVGRTAASNPPSRGPYTRSPERVHQTPKLPGNHTQPMPGTKFHPP